MSKPGQRYCLHCSKYKPIEQTTLVRAKNNSVRYKCADCIALSKLPYELRKKASDQNTAKTKERDRLRMQLLNEKMNNERAERRRRG